MKRLLARGKKVQAIIVIRPREFDLTIDCSFPYLDISFCGAIRFARTHFDFTVVRKECRSCTPIITWVESVIAGPDLELFVVISGGGSSRDA